MSHKKIGTPEQESVGMLQANSGISMDYSTILKT
jgi:hypothetical protein